MTTAPTNRPTHDLVLISSPAEAGGRDVFTTICAAWINKDGESFTANIPAGLTLSGRVLIQKRKDRTQGDA